MKFKLLLQHIVISEVEVEANNAEEAKLVNLENKKICTVESTDYEVISVLEVKDVVRD